MRKFLGCCSILLLVSCLNETRVDPATPSTFVRYINGGNQDEAVALKKTEDGYVILANSKLVVSPEPAGNKVTEKIKLVKVNPYGSVVWTRVLPVKLDDAKVQSTAAATFHANGIYASDEGYIISGEYIQGSGKRQLLIVETNLEGVEQRSYTVDLLSAYALDAQGNPTIGGNVRGMAVTRIEGSEVADKRFLVLASLDFTGISGVTTPVNENMILAEVIPRSATIPDDSVAWHYRYGNGTSTLVNQMFVNANREVSFGGTVFSDNNLSDLRLVKAVQNSQSTIYDLPFGEPARSERAGNICATANGFAVVGSTDVAGQTHRDIQFTRLSASGGLLSQPLNYDVYYDKTTTDVQKDEEGNDICTTKDGGFIILATIVSAVDPLNINITLGRGETDYYLIKVNAFGVQQWARAFGSSKADTGVAVLQADDEGYVILGTTNLANLSTITLIKTNSLGEIE